MAIAFVGAGTGAERLTTGTTTVSKTSCTAGNLIVFSMIVNGTTGDWSGFGSRTNVQNFAGTTGQLEFLINTSDRQIAFGRVTANGTCSATFGPGASGEDCAAQVYEFSGFNTTGTTMATCLENGASTNAETSGTGTTIDDADVTCNGPGRMAINFLSLKSSQTVAAFTGETGGDWTEAVAEYQATTLTLSCQIASLSSGATIQGGSITVSSTAWYALGLAPIPAPDAPVGGSSAGIMLLGVG